MKYLLILVFLLGCSPSTHRYKLTQIVTEKYVTSSTLLMISQDGFYCHPEFDDFVTIKIGQRYNGEWRAP